MPAMSKQLLTRLPQLLALLMFALLCVTLTHWWLVLSADQGSPSPIETRQAQSQGLENGAAATLFGGTRQGAQDVQLLGVVAELDHRDGVAILALDDGTTQAMRVGQRKNGVKVLALTPRTVLIERQGVRQELALPSGKRMEARR